MNPLMVSVPRPGSSLRGMPRIMEGSSLTLKSLERHPRERGGPAFHPKQGSWIPAYAGMTGDETKGCASSIGQLDLVERRHQGAAILVGEPHLHLHQWNAPGAILFLGDDLAV